MKNDRSAEFVEDHADVEAKPVNTTAKQKKPYVKPAFRYENVFVTTALSCGKLSGTCTISKVS